MPQIALNRHHSMATLRRSKVGSSFRAVSLLALAVVVFLAGAPGAHASEWEWEIIPYVFVADVGLDASLNEADIVDTTIDFGDILSNTEVGGFLSFKGRKGRGGFFVDLVYLSLADDRTTSGRPLIPDGTMIDGEFDQFTGEAGGIYKLTGDEQGLDLLFGARVMDVSLDIGFDFPDASLLPDRSRSGGETLIDGFVGLRFAQDISDRWQWSIRGDVGTGDTDLTWQGMLAFGAKLGKDHDKTLYLGYRHLAYEFDAGTNDGIADREVAFTGPAVGFGFSF
jgi:hypothetical protein